MFIINLLLFILALSILIFVHELGHFIFAKMFNVHCKEFAIGMGPAIIKKKFKWDDETTYSIRAFPIGGFVSMAGEMPGEEKSNIPPERTINGIKAWKRAIIISAGVVFNFIFAFLLTLVVVFGGMALKDDPILNVDDSSIAYQEGLRTGDEVFSLSISGDNNNVCEGGCSISKASQLFQYLHEAALKEEGQSQIITLEVLRDDSELTFQINREYDVENERSQIIGISQKAISHYPGFFEGIALSFEVYFNFMGEMFKAIGHLFTGQGLDSVGGPVEIFRVSSEVSSMGILPYVWFVAIISINLAFFNLLPIPGLDGSRLLTSIFEMITKKKIKPEIENMINFIGILFLLSLIVLITIRDISRIF